MRWMLDTNACIRYLNGRAPHLQRRLDATKAGDVCICSVVKAELFYGSARSANPAQSRAIQAQLISGMKCLPFDDSCVDQYAVIRCALAKAGTPIGPIDTLIAAIAVTHGVILVTHNTSEFSRVAGLSIEDWEIP